MKKKLRYQIEQLAQKLLSRDVDHDTKQLKETAKTIYEKLAVLEYLESQLLGEEQEKESQLEKKEALDSKSYREHTWFKDPEPVPQPEDRNAIVEPVIEKIKDLVAQMPEEGDKVDALLEEVLPKKEIYKNDLEDFASNYQDMPVFERKDLGVPTIPKVKEVFEAPIPIKEEDHEENPITHNDVARPKSINETLNKGMQIGLNDRLAFIKHLFNGSTEDYTRVLSQINTLHTFEEANNFIKGKVKPDYNFWLQKEDVAKRFMKVVEQSFS